MSNFLPSEYLVCFYDVLGQKQWMQTILKDGCLLPDKGRDLNQVAHATTSACKTIRDDISAFEKEHSITLDEGIDYGVQQFSDSTVIYVRNGVELAPLLFHQILLDVASHILECQSIGLGIRGGVTIGLIWPVSGGSFCGPALDEVSDLETKTAFWQRIVFSDRFVQWIGQEMAIKKAAGKRGDGLLCLNALLHFGVDTECYLNIFSEAVQRRMGEDKFKGVYETAKQNVHDILMNCKEHYVWKYFFSDDSYRFAKESIECEWKVLDSPFNEKSDAADVKVGKYLVYYIKLLPLSAIPRDKGLIKSGWCNAGYSTTNPTTVKLLQDCLSYLSRWKNRWQSQMPQVETGYQHIGNYLLVFVKDAIPEAYLAFVDAILTLDTMHLLALHAQHFTTASIVIGEGWTVADNCLCGPVVGEADSLAVKNMSYPRIVISQAMFESMHTRSFDGVGVRLNGKIQRDLDGKWIWNVYAGIDQRKDISGIKVDAFIEDVITHYTFRHLFMWHFRFRNNEGSNFARQMHLVERKLMGAIETCGMNDLFRKGESAAIEDLKCIEPLKPGGYPWILGCYVDAPVFGPRTGSSLPWVDFASVEPKV